MKKKFKIPLIVLAALAAVYVVLVIIRMFHFYNLDKTNEQVTKIHNTKLTINDVMGKNLSLDPGAEADKTIQGVDANKNGIRDDVELAIFKKYPDSAKIRAALLQYALALQMETVQEMVNEETVGEIANKQDRAFFCLAKIVPSGGESSVIVAIEKYGNIISNLQFNTELRKTAHKQFYSNLKSGRIDDSISCDIDPLSLID